MAYNADGTLASLTKPGPRTTSYKYDKARRRTRETNPLGHATTMTYTLGVRSSGDTILNYRRTGTNYVLCPRN